MLNIGDAFLLSKPGESTAHLWVVITERNPKTHEAVCVSISSTKPYTPEKDKHLELAPNEHPFITKPSVVVYKDARVLRLDLVENAFSQKNPNIICKQKPRCSRELLAKIQKSLASSSAQQKIKDRCDSEWNPDPDEESAEQAAPS